MADGNRLRTSRRDLLRGATAAAVAAIVGDGVAAASPATSPAGPDDSFLGDRFWIWTHQEGVYKRDYGLPKTSRMTPVEGAVYLGVRNLLFIRYKGSPPMPFDPYAIAFRPMKRVVWSLVGASGQTQEAEREHVLKLAERFPNMVGFVMDDFFHADGTGSLSVEQLRELRRRLTIAGRKRDLYVVLYDHQLDLPVRTHLEQCDRVTFWTWQAKNLKGLEASFDRFEKVAPEQGKLLGCYLWDFGGKGPMPLDLMRKQCELGLQWLEQGRIEGMVFLASNVCDLELEAVEWTRRWIAEVGRQPVNGRGKTKAE